MTQTNTLIIGGSFSGLAAAACLQKKSIEYILIEKNAQVVSPWHNHYDRLHLHTNKRISHLPYVKFARNAPRYPSRIEVIEYAEAYQQTLQIKPRLNTEAINTKRTGERWITTTTNGVFESKHLIVATGAFGKPKPFAIPGAEQFPGKILHSSEYKSGKDFSGQKILVVGFGNSACEIAIDLYEQGAHPFMSVRSPVNIIPRDVFGIPILEISQLMSRLPPKFADRLNAPILRTLIGDIKKLGLQKLPYGPFEQIRKTATIPVIDIGIVKHIRSGHVSVFGAIDHIEGSTVVFSDGRKELFDAIIAAIGYDHNFAFMIETDPDRFNDLKRPVDQQHFFGKDGLYFCGFYVSPTGQIREIGLDAQKIAADIAG